MPLFAIIWIILGFSAGFMACLFQQWQIKRTALSIANTRAGELGRSAKKEQEGELMAMLMEGGNAFKAAKEAGENMQTAAARIVPQLVAKYPGVAMKQGKKLMKIFKDYGGMEGLEEFF